MAKVTFFHGSEEILKITESDIPSSVSSELNERKTDDRYSFEYSGKHDHGNLPDLKRNNVQLKTLSQFLNIAKEKTVQGLSEISKRNGEKEQPKKKHRV